MRPIFPTTLLLLAPVIALAQSPVVRSNAELMANDHYTRSHDYDLVHQRIALSAFDWDSASFTGQVTTTVVSRRAGLATLYLDEGPLLINSSVMDRAGKTLTSWRRGDTLAVIPTRPLRFGDTLVFTIKYRGRVEGGHGLTFIHNDGLRHRPDQIWSQGEDHDNHYWFPTYDFPNDKMTWELTATVPKANLAISNGRLVSNVVTGSTRTMSWNQDTPSASYLVSLVVAPLAKIHDTWQGIPVDYYTYHDDSTRAWRLFHVTPDMIGTYSKLTGIKYPWAKYAQTTVADFFGGMENVSATTLVDWLPDATAYLDRPWYQYILIPHELAHQWFGDFVTTENWANMWLNEGFAEFMPGQYWNEKLGAHAAQDYYLDEYRQFLQIEQQRSMPLASLGSNNIYPKGALVIAMLKDYLGPERFWASVHEYLTRHAHAGATSDDFRQAVLAATGENLDWFWDEWVYGAGLPRFVVTSSYDSASARLQLHVQQTQTDTFTVDSTGRRFSVATPFRMPVAVRVAFAGKERVQHFDLSMREQTLTIDSITTAPSMVIFDDGNHILKTLQFDQPVPWLVAQLSHDSNLWNREWALAQLTQHRDDATAAAAVATAATGADYFLTRAQAANLLSAFPAPLARPVLLSVLKDTSSAVRSTAIWSLSQLGPDVQAAAAIRAAFLDDPSYSVRAGAVIALARLDPAQDRTLLARALGTTSYQDAVQQAALQAVAELNDTTSLAAVDALTSRQERAMQVLAVLAGRGSARALDLLILHLNDSGTAVRRWAVNAFRDGFARANKAQAIAALDRASGALTHADTREAVAALLVSLREP